MMAPPASSAVFFFFFFLFWAGDTVDSPMVPAIWIRTNIRVVISKLRNMRRICRLAPSRKVTSNKKNQMLGAEEEEASVTDDSCPESEVERFRTASSTGTEPSRSVLLLLAQESPTSLLS